MSPIGAEPPTVHVLVVEDDGEQREMLVAALARMGCRVDAAKDGAEAHRLARRHRPHVILMDLNLPSMSGWEAMRSIREAARSDEDAGDAPYVVVYSALGTAEARRAAFAAGCNEFVVKPLDVGAAIRAYALRRGLPLATLAEEPAKADYARRPGSVK